MRKLIVCQDCNQTENETGCEMIEHGRAFESFILCENCTDERAYQLENGKGEHYMAAAYDRAKNLRQDGDT